MSNITVLPASVADQIAAGEVVERPFSVVKELVENSLDAGASQVDIVIEEGGRALIRISDNGSGMDYDDALLSLERHGTSKIREAADLTGVGTFGFRGEALPAIGSVSRLELITATSAGDGTRIRVEGGGEKIVSPAARRQGTTVSVENLFYNVPAREKFLRSSRTEWRAIVESLTGVALSRCDVRITASNDGKVALNIPESSGIRDRLAAVWGGKYAERLLEVNEVSGDIKVVGLIERPSDVGTGTRRVYISINDRPVRDHGVVRAAERAYRSTIPAGLRPSLFLNISVPVGGLDVNVHPAKAEVRFQDRWNTEKEIERCVRRALGDMASSASIGKRFVGASPLSAGYQTNSPVFLRTRIASDTPLFEKHDPAQGRPGEPDTTAYYPHSNQTTDPRGIGEGSESGYINISAEPRKESDEEAVTDLVVPTLFQLHRTYIAFQHEDGLVLIDQHSAHERILFEQFMRNFEGGGSPSQKLLIPLTLHLGAEEADAFEQNAEYLLKLGYEIEGFGGTTLIVNSVPAPHRRFDAERCLRDTLSSLIGSRIGGTATRHENLAATVACKGAIKAGEILSHDEMKALFIALRDTELPAHDVHGRSTIVQLSWDEIDRRFGRS